MLYNDEIMKINICIGDSTLNMHVYGLLCNVSPNSIYSILGVGNSLHKAACSMESSDRFLYHDENAL